MTKALKKAFEAASRLPDREQDELAAAILEDLDADERWEVAFARSLYGAENVPAHHEDRFLSLLKVDLKTARARALKESLRYLWSYRFPEEPITKRFSGPAARVARLPATERWRYMEPRMTRTTS